VFEKLPVFILDLSGLSVGFSTALRPKHLCMPLYCQDSITAMLCLLACLKNLLIVFRECKMRQLNQRIRQKISKSLVIPGNLFSINAKELPHSFHSLGAYYSKIQMF
jgi:hypothetical protein